MDSGSKRTSWIVGGTTLIGFGVGLVLLESSALAFVASIVIGIGAGLVLIPLVEKRHG